MTTGVPAKKDVLERTHAQKKKNERWVNADLRSIGDPIRTEGPNLTIVPVRLIGPSEDVPDRRLRLETRRNAMRFFVASLIVLVVLYFWDQDYNDGRLFEGLESLGRSISHSTSSR